MGVAAGVAGKARALLVSLILAFAPAVAFAQCANPFELSVAYGAMNFTQTRHLSGVRAPLIAHGRAEVAAERVEWRVTDPVDILTTITAAGVTQSIENGPPQRVGPQGDAFLSSVGLSALLAGDLSVMRTHYEVARQPAAADGDWRVRLTPRAPALARYLTHIEVGGCQRIDRVEVRQANGDWMEIVLSPLER